MNAASLTEQWWTQALSGHDPQGRSPLPEPGDTTVARLEALLRAWAEGFAARRDDVRSSTLALGKRGLHVDEASGFLRALDDRLLHVDSAGLVTPLAARTKSAGGRYALICKNGDGTSINLEYLIQLATAAELVIGHGWPPGCLQVERGEFDLIGFRAPTSQDVVMAVEAKARVRGSDSLEKLLKALLSIASDPSAAVGTNAQNKYRELLLLVEAHPVVLWLVAAGARWAFDASLDGHGSLRLRPRDSIAYPAVVADAVARLR